MARTMEQARTRSDAWALFSGLIEEGLDEDSLKRVRLIQPLAEALPESIDLDDLAAQHYGLFGLEAPAFAGAFLDSKWGVGESASLEDFYGHYGFVTRRNVASIDHLGVAMSFLSYAAGHEARGGASARKWTEAQSAFLGAHLLIWLPAYVVSCGGSGLWPEVLRLALEFAASEFSELGGGHPPNYRLPGGLSLDDPKIGLREIAAFIADPAQSGVLLTRTTISELANEADIPGGFGARSERLEGILRGAAEYGVLSKLIGGIEARFRDQQEQLQSLGRRCALEFQVAPSLRRIERSLDTMEWMRKRVDETPTLGAS